MYQIVSANSIRHTPSGTVFPLPPVESFGHDYQRWLDAGNIPEPAQIPLTPIPEVVSRRQARQALLMAGKLALVQPAIDSIAEETQRKLAQIEWEDSAEFKRDWPLLIQLASAIGLTSTEIDDLFVLASSL